MRRPKGKSQKHARAHRAGDKTMRLKKRRGLPDKTSIVSTKVFQSPTGKRFNIVRTNERDEYEAKADETKLGAKK